MHGKRILLIVGGGIAAFKALELTRTLRRAGHTVSPVLTAGGARFVTPLSLAALAASPVHDDLWSLDEGGGMGHIELSRAADLIVVCPATADLLAKMAAGIADDLATTLLLATDTPVLAVPAMNVRMWTHAATVANVATLRARGVSVVDPDDGPMACGEFGPGRLPEIDRIVAAIDAQLPQDPADGALRGRHIVVTAGPTHEPIDPVRFLGNRSSGKQGFAVAAALAGLGARVTLVAGPVALATPPGVTRIDVETARQMAAAVDAALPADAAVLVAAVADWGVAATRRQAEEGRRPAGPDPDAQPRYPGRPRPRRDRPRLVVGFAAETRDTVANAVAKRTAKGADWIVANDVSGDVMGGDANTVHLVTADGVEDWPPLTKVEVARRLADRIAEMLRMTAEVAIAVEIMRHAHGLDLPAYATAGAAGMDAVAAVDRDLVLAPGGRAAVPTGLKLAIPDGYELQVRPRSGLALKHGLTVANAPGTIDSDYRGELMVLLANLGPEPVTITRGMRIAQLVVAPVVRGRWVVVETVAADTVRGSGGFGSTGH